VRDLPPPRLPLWVLPVRLVIESGLEIWQRRLAGVLAHTERSRPCS
jgi:hypothetical protein